MVTHRFATLRSHMPEQTAVIDEVLRTGEDFEGFHDFIEACEDYEACQRALAEPLLKDYATEFRVLGQEIEEEILRYLARFSSSRAGVPVS
jgi:hypothetical protein